MKAAYKQSIFDISVKYYGGLDSVSSIIRQNRINFDDELTTGQEIEIVENEGTINEELAKDFFLNKDTNNGDDQINVWATEDEEIWVDENNQFWEWK